MAPVDEYLQTWKLNFKTTKRVLAVFYLKKKVAKCELKANRNNKTLPFCSEPKYLGVTFDTHVSPTPRVTSQKADITHHTPEAVCWFWLGFWSNNVANSQPCPCTFNSRVLHFRLVPQCSYPPYWPRHQRRLVNCDWMPASYTSGQLSYNRRHPSCWALSQWSYTLSSMPCHGAWTPAPLGAHLSTECMEPQIETPICTHRKQLPSSSDNNNNRGAAQWADHITNRMRSGWTTLRDSILPTPTLAPTFLEWLSQEQRESSFTASAPLLLAQMAYGLLCGLWVWCRRTNRWPCCPPMANPSTSSWNARPDGSERWDNRFAA